MKIVVWDAEIVNDIDGKVVRWTDFDKMHISVACAFDYTTGDYKVFHQDNLQGLIDLLVGADMLAAFNSKGFDNPLIVAEAKRLGLTELDLEALNAKTYDMLEESRKGYGWTGGRFPSGFKLDDHLMALWGPELLKTESGALAPRFWREGQTGKISDYCLSDVRRERQLFEWAWYGGLFKCAISQGHPVRPPQEMLGLPLTSRLPYFGGPFTEQAVTTIMAKFNAPASDV